MLLAAIPHVVAFFGAILFGCAILLAVRILTGGGEQGPDLLHQTLRRVAWLLILSGIIAILLAAGVIPAIVALIVLPAVVHRRRRAHRYALLAAMAVAVQRQIPLIPVLLAFSTERRGYVARKAMDLAARLQAGWALPDAVDSVRGLFPPPIRLAIRMGHDSGDLAAVLRDVSDRSDTTDAVEAQITGKFVYFAVVFFFMLLIVIFVMMKIIPAFQRIFEEFGVELPNVTILVVKISYAFLNYWFLLMPLIAFAMFLGIFSALRYMGVIERDLLGMSWLRRRIHTATVCDTLAMFTGAERSVADGVEAMAQWYPTGSVRRRLVHAVDDIRSGRDWCESLARRRLISQADRGVLGAAQRVGNLPWALTEMAESNRRRYAYRATAIVHTVFVAILLGYGFVVFIFFLGIFVPLIKLISGLT
jgi:type II secretory pathway component PulF